MSYRLPHATDCYCSECGMYQRVPSTTTGSTQPYSEELPDGPMIFPGNPNDLAEIVALKAERDQLATRQREIREEMVALIGSRHRIWGKWGFSTKGSDIRNEAIKDCLAILDSPTQSQEQQVDLPKV